MSAIDKFKKIIDESDGISEYYSFLEQMYNTKDIELKSEVHKPRNIVLLKLFGVFCSSLGLIKSTNLLDEFRKYYLGVMVSFKREGRKEAIEALKWMNSKPKDEDESLEDVNIKG